MTKKLVMSFLGCAFLALVLGYLLATPDDLMTFGVVGMVLFVLCIPLLLRWHYPILIFSLNATMILYFFPGQPSLWMFMALVSLLISVLHGIIDKRVQFLKAPLVTLPLLFLGVVVLLNARFTGGFGLASFGGQSIGGKKYVLIFASIVAYFALIARSVPKERVKLYTILFFASGLTALVSNLIYMAGSPFYFLFGFFPAGLAVDQAMATEGYTSFETLRIAGLQIAGLGVFCALLASNGLREILNLHKPLKLLLLVFVVVASLFGGYRSVVVTFGLVFVLLFFFQGLHRTRHLPAMLLAGLLGTVILIPFVKKLPFSVQRALSVLPLNVDPSVSAAAEGSSQWRIEIWKTVTPEIPQYFWKGKGYAINPTDLYLAEQRFRYGLGGNEELTILAGDYHSGPLSVIIPFGIFGVIGFVWFLVASSLALYKNYRCGESSLQKINSFLFAYFLSKIVFFLFVFGSVSSDLLGFVSLVGLSISLNGGIKEKKHIPQVQFEPEDATLASA